MNSKEGIIVKTLYIKSAPVFSAIYYALLQNGYEYYQIERSEPHISQIKEFVSSTSLFPYFADAKQNTCEVYPFWPRAALLEEAAFYVDTEKRSFRDFDSLYRKTMSASNLKAEERNTDFWKWLKEFPIHLHEVIENEGFRHYLAWEALWLEQQSAIWKNELENIQHFLMCCGRCFDSKLPELEILISPIKCVYSSDYHLIGNRFIYTGGKLRTDFIIHEFFHPIVHTIVLCNRQNILYKKTLFEDLDPSYYLDGTDDGYLNAFEEKLVRVLTEKLIADPAPQVIQNCIHTFLEAN